MLFVCKKFLKNTSISFDNPNLKKNHRLQCVIKTYRITRQLVIRLQKPTEKVRLEGVFNWLLPETQVLY